MNEKALTISEILFERFCAENNVTYCRIPHAREKGIKTPDYKITTNGIKSIVEVKQLDPESPDDKKRTKQLEERGETEVYQNKVRHRIRKKIDDAMPQLKKWTKSTTPGLLFMYSNLPLDGRFIEPRYILEAMYGREASEIILPNSFTAEPYIRGTFFGEDRGVSITHNKSLSAIVSIFEDWDGYELHAHFYHNIFTKCIFDPDWLRRNRVKHFSLADPSMKRYSEWIEI
jgi:hypothetical protein